MSYSPQILELAKKGHPDAIATLLKHWLRDKDIRVMVCLNHQELQVILIEPNIHEHQAIAPMLGQNIERLGLPLVKTLIITGQQTETAPPLWNHTIALHPSSLPHSAQSSASIHADIDGSVSGQIAVGNYIVQIGSVHGGTLYVGSQQHPTFTRQGSPVLLLPRKGSTLFDRRVIVSDILAVLGKFLSAELYGSVGIGKSALLSYLAYHPKVKTLFPTGIVYLSARHRTIADLLQILFDLFYVSDIPAKPSDAQLRQHLGQLDQVLILIDNVTLKRSDVEEIINALPQAAFLLATLHPLVWRDACCQTIAGLPLEDSLLLVEHCLGQFLEAKERTFAQTLCQTLKGNPLHILQAVSLVKNDQYSWQTIVQQVRTKPPEQLVLEVATTLPQTERSALMALATLGGLTLTFGQLGSLLSVANPNEIVERLRDLGLVQIYDDLCQLPGQVSQLIQQQWEISEWQERALAFLKQLATDLPETTYQAFQSVDSIWQGIQWAIAHQRWTDALQLGQAIERTLALSGQWDRWLDVLNATLQSAQALGDQGAIAWSLHQMGIRASGLNNPTQAQELLTQATQIRASLGDQAGAAASRHNLDILSNYNPLPNQAAPQTSNASSPIQSLYQTTGAKVAGIFVTSTVVVGGCWYGFTQRPPASLSPNPETVTAIAPSILQVATSPLPTTWTLGFPRYQFINGECYISHLESTSITQTGNSFSGSIPWSWAGSDDTATLSGTLIDDQFTMMLTPPAIGGFRVMYEGQFTPNGTITGQSTAQGECEGVSEPFTMTPDRPTVSMNASPTPTSPPSSPAPNTGSLASTYELSGTWKDESNFVLTVDDPGMETEKCYLTPEHSESTEVLIQRGNQLIYETDEWGTSGQGKLSGNQFEMTFFYTDSTTTHMAGTISADGNTIAGYQTSSTFSDCKEDIQIPFTMTRIQR
jgi:hypothetical protein